jgi:hypothetical protein
MGEAKRRSHRTLDGGPPSKRQVPLRIDIFDPLRAVRERTRDLAKRTVMLEAYRRIHRLPARLCSACDYEFGLGEPPPCMFCTQPEFPQGNGFMTVGGAICGRCADLPDDKLFTALVHHLRVVMPDATIISVGRA